MEQELSLELTLFHPSFSPEPPGYFICMYCDSKFFSSQALGGHQNAHKYERSQAKRRREIAAALRAHGAAATASGARPADAAAAATGGRDAPARPQGTAGTGTGAVIVEHSTTTRMAQQKAPAHDDAAPAPAPAPAPRSNKRRSSDSGTGYGVERAEELDLSLRL